MNIRSTSARTENDVAVVGGGPAGMIAALFAAREGARVVLLERNEKLGKKLYITGKGRCNVTNVADFEEFFAQVPRNPRFLNAAVRTFDAGALRALLDELGVPTVVQRGGRVFPESEKASDVTRAFERALRAADVQVRLGARVESVQVKDGHATGVTLEGGECVLARAVIVATGGVSYPSTGSTGDGYRFAREAGHAVEPPRPSLVGMTTRDEWPRSLQGLSLRNVRLSARMGKKKLYDELGEMLFTHFGLSGPLVLELSSHMTDLNPQDVQVRIDLKPGLTPEQLDRRIQRDFEQMQRRQLSGVLSGLLPQRLAALFPALCGLDGAMPVHQVTRAQRLLLAQTLKALPVEIEGMRPVDEAIVTRGGVDVKEIVPGTMASKRVPGLYFAGEVLDVDAHTGGFNLQIAFSTGALAGRSAAREGRM